MRAISVICALLGTVLQAQEATFLPDSDEAAYPAIERFVEVLEQVRHRHPDLDKVSYDRLINHALEGMLGSLDPHSSFIHPEMAAMMREDPELDPFVSSLGISIGWREDGPYLATILPGSAAPRNLEGFSLLGIDGNRTDGMRLKDILGSLHGAAGTSVVLNLQSPNRSPASEVRLTRHAVEDRVVSDFHMIPDTKPPAGYLRLSQFSDASAREVEAALDDLEDQGMKRLILDLRGNPGGSVAATVRILGFWLPPKTEVLRINIRDDAGEDEVLHTSDRQRRTRDYPIAVLVDRMSASASELTSGVLQDLKRGTVFGETSYGKGSVQEIIPMSGGTALRLTIATYHTPSGNTPHLKGIKPDVVVETDENTREKVALSFRGESLDPEQAKRLVGWTDPVIKAAIHHQAPGK